MTDLIELRGVVKRYGPTVALAGLDLDLRPGEVLGIAGPNGAGKSTLVRVIAGEERPTEGHLTLGGRPWSPAEDWRRVAVVHQEPQLFPNLTVAENLMVGREGGARLRPRPGAGDRAVMDSLGLAPFADRPLGLCSLAVQQRTEIARAVAREARVFLFDEPNSALTGEESRALFEEMRRLAGLGCVVALITHRLADLVGACARVVVVRDGRIRATLAGAALTEEAIARELVTEGGAAAQAGDHAAASRPLLAVEGWTHARAFRDVGLEAPGGRILALMGVEGSGARELLRSLAGLERARGRLTVEGAPAAPGPAAAYVPATRAESLYTHLTVGDNLLVRLGRPAIAGPGGALSRRRMRRLAAEAVRRFHVKGSADQPIRALSGGNQQKVAIAQALARRPRVLLLEEPTRGVDIQSKAEIYRTLRDYAAEGHAVVLYCTEALEAFEAADQVLTMAEGRLRAPIAVRDHASVEDLAAAIVRAEDAPQAA